MTVGETGVGGGGKIWGGGGGLEGAERGYKRKDKLGGYIVIGRWIVVVSSHPLNDGFKLIYNLALLSGRKNPNSSTRHDTLHPPL